MTRTRPTALIADDEPLLREALAGMLARAWPELDVVAEARNGRDAVRRFEEHSPDVCFLDIHMPGLSGVEAAHRIGRRAHVVFVTAHDQYAVQAFAEGALDYLVKPVDPVRLADTVARLRDRLRAATPALNTETLIEQLAERLLERAPGGPLRWIRAQVGPGVRLIPTDAVDYLRSDSKYTLVAWRGDDGRPAEALVRMALKELLSRLDPAEFVQVHRAVVVNLAAIAHVTRREGDRAEIRLKHRDETLPVSRSYLHLFRGM
jgi:DNA-binding LytR/AlgR family response regulator